MAYDFPNSPTVGQAYSGYVWDGEKWVSTPNVPNTAGVIGIQVFTSSGTYTPSANMTTCVIECVGGGGGGGGAGAAASSAVAAGGGGGGGYSRKLATAAQISVSQTITIGAQGSGGAAGANAGAAGGDTSVGLLCMARGGGGGGAASTAVGGGSGGAAGTGDLAVPGATANSAFGLTTSVNIIIIGSNGASSGYGGGGRGGAAFNSSVAGAAASGYGAGGGGAATHVSSGTSAGGNGVPGLVIVTEYGMTALTGTATGAVRYDLPQGLTANQTAQARANIWVTKKNYIINGGMMVSQENGTTLGNTNAYYAVDQFFPAWVGTMVLGAQQVAVTTPSGSPNRLRITTGTLQASLGAADVAQIVTRIEGLRMADLMWGTANAKTVTLQFGFKGPAGTYHVAIRNNTGLRSYIASFVISAANTDTVQTFVIPGETTGVWLADTGIGLSVTISLAAGTNAQGVLGWQSANFTATSAQTNGVAASGTWELFDVSLTEGTVAPPFQLPDYASELALCMRYYETFTITVQVPAASGLVFPYPFKASKRALPVMATIGSPTLSNATAALHAATTADQAALSVTATAVGGYVAGWKISATARL